MQRLDWKPGPGLPESKFGMQGTLHIFRRRIVNGGEIYQVNFTYAGSSFAKVFARAWGAERIPSGRPGLDPSAVDSLWQDMDRAGTSYAR